MAERGSKLFHVQLFHFNMIRLRCHFVQFIYLFFFTHFTTIICKSVAIICHSKRGARSSDGHATTIATFAKMRAIVATLCNDDDNDDDNDDGGSE